MKGSHQAQDQIDKEARDVAEKQAEEFNAVLGDTANKVLKQGMTPKEAAGLSNDYMENVYAQAYRLYQTGKYVEAIHLFRMLIMLNAMEPKYMLGLAACFHLLKEYTNAIQIYTMCSALDPRNPLPHYHASDCFIQMKEFLSAMICLELVIQQAGNRTEYAKIKERAQLSVESLKQQVISVPLEEDPLSSKEPPEKSG
jgi:type III secretion system low calcium response chaperone LcrH/SycD